MKVSIDNNGTHITSHYLQSLALLYFPCEVFGKGDTSERSLCLSLNRDSLSLSGTLTFCDKDKLYTKSDSRELTYYVEGIDAEKCFVGELFLELFRKFFALNAPWGMLTGVRPARFCIDLMRKGFARAKAEEILTKYFKVSEEKASLCAEVALFEKIIFDNRKQDECNIYIGIPFCPTKCKYCSFVSYATPRLHSLIPGYIKRLNKDIDLISNLIKALGMKVKTVYIGGGTPGILDLQQTESLLSKLEGAFDMSCVSEFTYEIGRPDTVSREKLTALKNHSVSRICINTQTTNDGLLSEIGRPHTFNDYKNAVCLAREIGFSNINTDLIAGLPGESYDSFKRSLEDTVSVGPDGITVHSFSVKKSSDYKLCGFDVKDSAYDTARMVDLSLEYLKAHGYLPYYMYRQKNTSGNLENVGYAKAGKECLYNINMMEEISTVFALGAGASTKIVDKDAHSLNLYNPKYPYEYLNDDSYIYKNREEILKFFNK